ncbi:MAG: pyridoxamine 5'-phosphate oxidase [Planctomycetales bacterium]
MTTDHVYLEAIDRFLQIFERARQTELKEPTATTLATIDGNRPVARVVLLRGVDPRGFMFFTNSHSDKGRQLAKNPAAALCFYWDPLGEQIRVEGSVQQVGEDESNTYWQTRERESQVGAWASLQSEVLSNRTVLTERFEQYEQKFAGCEIARPEHWYGYRIVPARIEFWKSCPHRLHQRIVYEFQHDGWKQYLLYP